MKKMINLASLLFWGIMLALTFFAREIHNSRLPHVETLTVTKQDFICTFTDESGNTLTTTRRAVGIPKSLTNKDLYVITQNETYGEMRYYAQKVDVMMYYDYDSEDYYAVMYGVSAGDKLIISSNALLSDEYPVEVYYDGQ